MNPIHQLGHRPAALDLVRRVPSPPWPPTRSQRSKSPTTLRPMAGGCLPPPDLTHHPARSPTNGASNSYTTSWDLTEARLDGALTHRVPPESPHLRPALHDVGSNADGSAHASGPMKAALQIRRARRDDSASAAVALPATCPNRLLASRSPRSATPAGRPCTDAKELLLAPDTGCPSCRFYVKKLMVVAVLP
jgi:hypothetical protein